MSSSSDIQRALSRLGIADVLQWGRANCSKPLVDLNRELSASVAPIDLEDFMADAAKQSGRYDDFVRTEAVRRLNEFFPRGFAGCPKDRHRYGDASGWSFWASLFEPSQEDRARATWGRLIQLMKSNPEWCPQSPDDPLVLSAFGPVGFEPSKDKLSFDKAVEFMEKVARKGNKRWSESKAVENLSRVKPGYGLLYGLLSLDGQVCNGGFEQFYENTSGVPAPLAISGFWAIGRDDLAAIVGESMQRAVIEYPEFAAELTRLSTRKSKRAPSLGKLDQAYYKLSNAEKPGWLESAMMELVASRPDIF